MPDDAPEPNDPLSPYFPSRVPDVPGNGRTLVALLLAAMLLLASLAWVVSLLG